jgi:hypothetical protein
MKGSKKRKEHSEEKRPSEKNEIYSRRLGRKKTYRNENL